MLLYIAAVFFLIITPGPGVLSAAGVGAAYGVKPGMRYVFGLFIGNNIVALAVISGLAALIFALPFIRYVLFFLSTVYLIYLALRIAFAGTRLSFIKADTEPGIISGLLLQPINPKAYVVNTTLFSGFSLFPDALLWEGFVKLLLLNAIWVPIHLAWLWLGTMLQRLNLGDGTQRIINYAMAGSMLIAVALAALSTSL